jgi:hypothetical protein
LHEVLTSKLEDIGPPMLLSLALLGLFLNGRGSVMTSASISPALPSPRIV